MIGKLTGVLGEKNPPEVLVECGGVGYEVLVPMSACGPSTSRSGKRTSSLLQPACAR